MTIAEELFQVADAAAEVLAYARADDLQKPLGAIRKACDEAKRAWSGSNLGYHANVYWKGLQPKPPEVQFSPEWGLVRRLGVRESAPWAWCTMDREEVIDAIISRAGSPDVDSLVVADAFAGELTRGSFKTIPASEETTNTRFEANSLAARRGFELRTATWN